MTPTLADLPRLRSARVSRVLAGTDRAGERLQVLGFTPGTLVEFERRAPFGGPLVLRVRGTLVCLRPREARLVEVEPLGLPVGEQR